MKEVGILFIMLFIFSCGEDEVFLPKKKVYFRIDTPIKEYVNKSDSCSFSFDFSKSAQIEKSSEHCWFDIYYPTLDARVYVSYKEVEDNLEVFIEDARNLAFKHIVKAIDIDETRIDFPEKNVHGLIYEIQGNAASSYQFYLTDSTQNFVRGSVYFNALPNHDSIAPVLDYIREDMEVLYETFEWK